MSEQPVAGRRSSSIVLLSAFLGAVIAIATIVVPIIAPVVALAVVIAFAGSLLSKPLRYGRLAGFGGVFIGAGAMYAYGVVNNSLACLGTTCSRGPDITPLAALAVGLLASGVVIVVVAGRRT
jgi:hypothetical protein